MDELRLQTRKADGTVSVDVLAYDGGELVWEKGVDFRLTEADEALSPEDFDKRIAGPASIVLSGNTGVDITPKMLRALING